MKTKILIFLFIIASILTAQEKKFYVKAGGGVQGIGAEYVSYSYYRFQIDQYVKVNQTYNQNFQSSFFYLLGLGYKMNDNFSLEVLLLSQDLHHKTASYKSSYEGYSISPMIKYSYPVKEYFYIYAGVGYSYNSLKHVENFTDKSLFIVSLSEENSKTKNYRSVVFNIGFDSKLADNLSFFTESGMNLIGTDNFSINYTDPNNDPRNRQPIEDRDYEYNLTNFSISAGLTYYIF